MDKNTKNSLLAWGIIWSAVGFERLLSNENIKVIAEATSVQWVQTFMTAYIYILLYEKWIDAMSTVFSERVKKILMWTTLWVWSGAMNYYLQENTWWSFTESVVMFVSSVLWIMAHEYKIPEKCSIAFRNFKLDIWK